MKEKLLFCISSLLRVLETPALFINFSTKDVLMKYQGLPFYYKSRASVMNESAWERLGSMTEISNSSVAHQHLILTYEAFRDALTSALHGGHRYSIKKHLIGLVTRVIFIRVLYQHHSVHILKLFNRKLIRLYGAIEMMKANFSLNAYWFQIYLFYLSTDNFFVTEICISFYNLQIIFS